MTTPGPCGCASTACTGNCGGDDGVGSLTRFAQPVLLDEMVVALGRERALDGLSTRDPADPALALADAYAGALAVLGFAAARIAEDGTLAVSQDRGALVDLTRLIGYMPRPAVSSATILSFEGETTPGAVEQATVPAGTRAATLPKDGKPPVSFETSADLVLRGEWNRLIARRSVAVPEVTAGGKKTVPKLLKPGKGSGSGPIGRRRPFGGEQIVEIVGPPTVRLVVAGVDVKASPGDAVIVAQDKGGWMVARIADILREPGGPPAAATAVADPAAKQPMTVLTLIGQVAVAATGKGPPAGSVVILGQRASTFGASAPDYCAVFPNDATRTEWNGLNLGTTGKVDLEGVIKDAMPNRAALFVAGTQLQSGLIISAVDAHRTGFNLSGPVTRIEVDGVDVKSNAPAGFNDQVRNLTVYIETQRLVMLALPDPDEMLPNTVAPDQLTVLGPSARKLAPGRTLVLQGTDAAGMPQVESATLLSVAAIGADTRLTFTAAVTNRFMADGLVVLGNVAEATQGTTIPNPPELLGSSSATIDAPVYPLAATPVAHVPAPGAKGFAAALDVGVNGRRYKPVDRFLDLADDRAWRLRPRRDGRFEVEFAGRLPTGINNVTARYRVGGGAAGNVEAGAISMVMTPVLGVAKVTNVTRAEGGTDAATPDAMRDAGETITTLDRVVALADYERFARAYRGVGRAMATELRIAMRRQIVLTISTGDPAQPQPTQALRTALAAAIAAASAPGLPPLILGFTDQLNAATITFAHDPALDRGAVETAVRAALLAKFGPDARGFGQSLWASQVMAAVQGVTGVVTSRVMLGAGVDPIAALGPTVSGTIVVPAVRVALDPAQLTLVEMIA